MAILALDIGRRVTGVACFDVAIGFPFPLEPIKGDDAATVAAVRQLARERQANTLVIGLPLLPDGTEGEQASHTRALAEEWAKDGLKVHFLDERYTSTVESGDQNSHAKAAVSLLQMALDRGLLW